MNEAAAASDGKVLSRRTSRRETDMNNSKRSIPVTEGVDNKALLDALVKKNLEVRAPDEDCYFCRVEE